MKIDVLAFSPHPDDVELYCSGTLLALKKAGYSTAIVDVTRGELSTRGTPEIRASETDKASELLGLDQRTNLDIPDGDVANNRENRLKMISALRCFRPETVLLPYPKDRHPDHVNTSTLVREALFYSGLEKIKSMWNDEEQPPYRPAKSFYYMLTHDFTPPAIVDISTVFDRKMEAIRAYSTQFYTGAGSDMEAATYVSSQGFMEALIARSRRLGFSIGVEYGEGFEPVQPFGIDAPVLVTSRPY